MNCESIENISTEKHTNGKGLIGRDIPVLIWSEDFVMQDDTGIIFLD